MPQHSPRENFHWDQILDFSQPPPPISDLTTEVTGPVEVSIFDFPQWDNVGYDLSSTTQGLHAQWKCGPHMEIDSPNPGSIASTYSNVNVTGDLLTDATVVHPRSAPATSPTITTDGLLFSWYSYEPSYYLAQQSPGTSDNGLSALLSGPYNLSGVTDQHSQDYDSFLTFPGSSVPLEEAIVTIPKSTLQAKEEQIRSLQAMVAALTAELPTTP
ncbi:hypothetical protein NMY22_g20205 [Coprinellus aureogranulatus]|nr:hypothetical protein NMY22_g20205 [Coprinellus aureogranulatus]